MAKRPHLPASPAATALIAPSLLSAFDGHRSGLSDALSGELSPAQTVAAVRTALDRAGAEFARGVDDPELSRAGLWLIEVIKSGAGVLDRALSTEIAYVETAPKPSGWDAVKSASPGMFYGAAGLLGVVGLVQGAGLVVLTAAVLAGIHTFQGGRLDKLRGLLSQKTPALTDERGRNLRAEARLTTDGPGLIGQITEALKTADYILARLAEPAPTRHWAETPRLAGLLQNLLEAGGADDKDFAMDLIAKELPGLLSSGGIEIVDYSRATRDLFDELPGMGEGPKREMSAPALRLPDGGILRRGTVWVRE